MRKILAFLLFCSIAGAATAETWPSRPLRLVIPFSPGGGADIAGRVVARELSDEFKQPVVVENRAGAGGTIAPDNVAKSPADGYSMVLAHVTRRRIQTDRLRAIAMTGVKPFEGLPGLPTVSESGVPGYEINNWYGIFVPVGTPEDIIRRLNAAVIKAVQNPEVRAKLIAAGLEPMWSTPAEFSAYVRSETTKWGKIVRDSGATAE